MTSYAEKVLSRSQENLVPVAKGPGLSGYLRSGPGGGDIILEVVGIQVSEDCYEKIRKRLSDMKPGDTITIKVLRAGRILQLIATRGR